MAAYHYHVYTSYCVSRLKDAFPKLIHATTIKAKLKKDYTQDER